MTDPAFESPEEEQDDALSSIVVTTIKEAEITKLQLITGVVLTVLAGLLMCYLLIEIQRQQYSRLACMMEEIGAAESSNGQAGQSSKGSSTSNELELECNDGNMTTVDIHSAKARSPASPNASSSSKRSLPCYTKAYIAAQVGTLILLNYLLLVYLPASISLSLLAAFLVWLLVLHQVILDEIFRRHRVDRVLAILSCFLVVAASLSLATFARMTQLEGTIYKGPARVIGYDTDQYSNEGKEAIRSDLLVSFGGQWACPENPTECKAKVNGVLCHDKHKKTDDGARHERGRLRPMRRQLAEEGNSTAGKDVDDLETENQELEKEVEDEDTENQDLEQDLEDEETTNEELNQDLEDEEEANGEGTADDFYYFGNYTYDDGWYDDAYWSSYDWSDLWGEYSCGELFTTDMDGLGVTYDYTKLPGNDSWPYVTIYGSCNSCDAYLVDFFSTEHFAEIQTFLVHSRYYGVASAFVGLLALLAGIKQRFMSPSEENEIELLACDETSSGSSIATDRPFVSL